MENILIRDMAVIERPRERLAKLGPEALKDAELLAIILRTGYRGHGVLEVAQTILTHNPLPELWAMPLARLCSLRGMGLSRAATLVAAGELLRRAEKGQTPGLPVIQSMNDVAVQALELRDKKKEHLMAIFLNARHQMIAKEVISIGTLTASLAHPREIFAPAIGKAAAGVILVHNLCEAPHKLCYVAYQVMWSGGSLWRERRRSSVYNDLRLGFFTEHN